MATGKCRQLYLGSLGLREYTFTALWDLPRPEGPFCLRGVHGLPAVEVGGGWHDADSPADRLRL